MKFRLRPSTVSTTKSPPSRGAWIEIVFQLAKASTEQSPPSRGAWIEIRCHRDGPLDHQSPPSRGAWIEILRVLTTSSERRVAPLAGGVD